jgi:STE24 endopeptidase
MEEEKMEKESRAALAKRYERTKLVLSIGESVLSFVLLLLFVLSGYAVELRNWVNTLAVNPYVRFLLYFAFLGLAFSLVEVPLSFYGGFYLEHRYGLSNQSFWGWLGEKMKMFFVALVLFVPLSLVFYYLLLHFPHTWWLWISVVLFVFSVILGRLAPQLIFPLFYKFEPLDDAELKARMERLAQKGGFTLQGVYRFNMSKDTKKANAAFTGLGKSRRIIIGDTLLENFSPDEIEAVFAHEVGHYVHRHIYKLLIAGTVETFLGFYLVYWLYNALWPRMGLSGQADLAALPLMLLIFALYSLVTTPLSNALSRHFEWQADDYALRNSSNPQAFPRALQKLAEQNLSDAEPSPVVEFFFYSHPAIRRRVEKARQMLKANESQTTKRREGSKI